MYLSRHKPHTKISTVRARMRLASLKGGPRMASAAPSWVEDLDCFAALPGPLRIGISFGSSSGLASSSVATSSARSLSLNSATQRLLHVLVAITGEVLALLGHPHAPRHTTHWSARDLRSYGTCECRSPPRHTTSHARGLVHHLVKEKNLDLKARQASRKFFFKQGEVA